MADSNGRQGAAGMERQLQFPCQEITATDTRNPVNVREFIGIAAHLPRRVE